MVGQRFAIPLDRVIGVTESTFVTPLPFSPPPFEGLVLAMGQVVPQISLAAPVKPMEFHQYLTLRIGREFLAVPLDRIQRLEASIEVTPIPDRGTGFHGLADVGDNVVPVIDLLQILSIGGEPILLEPNPPCLLAMVEGGIAGVIVHQVLPIETVPESHISPAEDAHNLPISQILHIQDRLMSVVSLDRLLPPL